MRRLNRRFAGPAFTTFLLLCALTPFDSFATRLLSDVTFEETVGHSDLIVLGEVGSVKGNFWHTTSISRILYTEHGFTITRVLSGEPSEDSLILLTQGGRYWSEKYQNYVGIEARDAISVQEGETIVACLQRLDANRYRFTGLAHGKYEVTPNRAGAPSISLQTHRRDLVPEGVRVWDKKGSKKPVGIRLSLDDLEQFIRKLRQPRAESASPHTSLEERKPRQ